VPFVHLGRQHAELADELRIALDGVLAESDAGHPAEVDAFEQEFAEFCRAQFAVGVASGTGALSLGLIAAGIGPGDEVILPAYAPITTALGILHAGATPVLCDVHADTGLIDTTSAAELIGRRTTAIVAVHLFGQVSDMQEVGEFAERHGLLVIEDAAEAHGASFAGARAGAFADVAAFSFHPRRNLGTVGNGGAVCTGDPAIAARVRRLRDLGQRERGEHVEIGFEAGLDGLQAAVLRVKLRHLEQKNAARRAWANLYRTVLPGHVTTLWEDPRGECVYHHFPVRVTNRDAVLQALRSAGVAAGVHCDPPLHIQPPLIAHRIAHVGVGASEEWSNEELSLPMFAELTVEEIHRVAGALESALEQTAA
jgi:dTDP-4-amino-4,6-dideoxygalactose transaminase